MLRIERTLLECGLRRRESPVRHIDGPHRMVGHVPKQRESRAWVYHFPAGGVNSMREVPRHLRLGRLREKPTLVPSRPLCGPCELPRACRIVVDLDPGFRV